MERFPLETDRPEDCERECKAADAFDTLAERSDVFELWLEKMVLNLPDGPEKSVYAAVEYHFKKVRYGL